MSETDELDRIERSIDIDATTERVWALVTRPGWWINSGEVIPEANHHREGEVDVVTHPEYGEFHLRTEGLDPMEHVAFRWMHGTHDESSTLVEFTLAERPGGVTLTVVESGFSSLPKPRAEWIADREGNVEGWAKELPAAKRFVEAGTAAA